MEKYNCENGALTIKINSIKCIHASVAPMNDRKYLIYWINLEASSHEKIILQIKRGPSGALSFMH